MTFAAAGGLIQAQGVTSFSLTTVSSGDFIVLEAVGFAGSAKVTGLSSSNVTWSVLAGPSAVTTGSGSGFATLFLGHVTAASTATVTVTGSSLTNTMLAGHEFSTTAGFAAVTADCAAKVDAATATVLFPALTPGHGAGELYFGFVVDDNTGTAGTTPGFTYAVDAFNNVACWNVSCGTGVQQPSSGTADTIHGLAVMLYEAPAPSTFPRTPLDLQCDINVGGWTGIAAAGNKAYQRDGTSPPLAITRGRPDETSSANASSAAFQVNNRNGNFSPKNPLGTWYGLLGRNTPARWSVPAIGNYLRLEDMASAVICPDSASLALTGDLDIRCDMTLTGIGPNGVVVAVKGYNGLYTGSQGTLLSWVLTLNADMTPQLLWSATGSVSAGIVQGQLPVPSRGRFALRATLAVATGTVTFYTAASMGGSFTQLGPAASGTLGASTSVYGGPGLGAPLTVGMATDLPSAAFTYTSSGAGICGRVWEFQLRNGIGGTLVADPVFSSQAAGTTGFTDSQGNQWAEYGTAEISSRDYRYHGELSSLPPKWDATGTDQYVAVTAGGLLRRLGQGSAPLLSPMARYYTVPGAPVTAAAWPMEDAVGSTQLGATVGQQPLFFSGSPTLASSSVFTGSSPLPVSNGASFTGTVVYAGTWTDNDVHWLMQLPSTPEPDGTVVAVIATTGAVALLTVTYNTASSGSLTLRGYDPTGALLFTSASLTGVNGKLYAVQAYLQASGNNVSLTVSVPGSASGSGVGTTFAGAIGAVRRVTLNPNGGLTATVFGHLAVLPVFTSVLALCQYQAFPSAGSPFTGPVTAWVGEPAGVRAGRLVQEQGFQFRGIGSLTGTPVMGPQSATDLVSLLQECESADRGMITEPRSCLGLGYRARSSMYSQAPLVLDYSLAQLGGTGTNLEPTYDDQYVRNDETVSRSGGTSSGASARYTLSDGSSMSTGVIGDYANSDSLNVAYDGQLANLASWIVHVGTVDEARWPLFPLNLARTELTSLWYSLLDEDLGDRFQAQNLPNVIVYDPADQIVSQVKESLGGFHYEMEWAAVPAKPYTVAVAGNARAATAGSQLATGINTTATSLSVQITAGNLWTTAGGDFPLDISIDGERITLSGISGSSSPQTFTVSARSVNGVVRPHSAGAAVQVWTPAVAAL